MNKALCEFSVQVYGDIQKYNDVLSKARCRIFYKYENRNGTYITDEFAEKLISSLPYTPVKGIYEDQDYTDHGTSREEGRIYGIVPENPNVKWEDYLDEDGITRTYACSDVFLFTALYSEANQIIGKKQSMELYAPSLTYHEAIIHNRRYVVFDNGCFLGLQILGSNVEPCFEGASFYTLQNAIEFAIDQIKKYGGTKMPNINFRLSDGQKHSAIFALLNPEFNEEGNWTVQYAICDVYDDYALAFNYEDCGYYRAYYAKDDEKDFVELKDLVKCYVLDVTESEKNTLDTLRALNGGTYELVSDVLTNAQENSDKVSAFSAKIEELNETVSTLETENNGNIERVNSFTADLETANNTIASLNTELDALKQYKFSIEKAQKEQVIEEYTALLSEEILDKYREGIDNFDAETLDMRLAYELKKNNSSVFTNHNETGYTPKNTVVSELDAILSKYKK